MKQRKKCKNITIIPVILLLLVITGLNNNLVEARTTRISDITTEFRFGDFFENYYVDFRLRIFNNSQILEFTPVHFEAIYSDVLEVELKEFSLNIKKFNKSMGLIGEKERLYEPNLKFNETYVSKNVSLGLDRGSKVNYLRVSIQISGTIKYGWLLEPLISFPQTVEVEASIEDIIFEVTPSSGIRATDIISCVLALMIAVSLNKRLRRRG